MPKGVKQTSSKPSGVKVHPRSQLVEHFVIEHGTELMRLARAHAASAADADDAYQRTLEAILTKAPEAIEGDHLMAWAATVARNETRMQHRRRRKIADDSFEQITADWSDTPATPDDRLIDAESIAYGREALKRLDTDQTRLLLLRADGFGYEEICETTGFSYAKVNRILCEARKSFRRRVQRLESGAECQRIEGILSMIADGEARESARRDAELHLENCLACQATLREFRVAPTRVASLLPLGTLATPAAVDWMQRVGDWFGAVTTGIQERAAALGAGAGQGAEMAFAKKAVVATAVTAALVAGGSGMQKVIADERGGSDESQMQLPTPDLPPSDAVGPSSTGGPSDASSTSVDERPRDVNKRDLEGRDPVVKPVPAPPVDQKTEVAPDPGDTQAPAGTQTGAPPPSGGVSP